MLVFAQEIESNIRTPQNLTNAFGEPIAYNSTTVTLQLGFCLLITMPVRILLRYNRAAFTG